MELVNYQPVACTNGEIANCDNLVAYARFKTKLKSQQYAVSAFGITVFTCILMCIGSVMITANTEIIII